jgi:hypothetical protein
MEMEMKVRAPVLGVLSNGPASSQPTGEHSNPFATPAPAITSAPVTSRLIPPLTDSQRNRGWDHHLGIIA